MCLQYKRKVIMVNIFFTDYNPIIAARDSCDSYVVKIPVEVATMLSAIHWRLEKYQGPVGSGLPLVMSTDNSDTSCILPTCVWENSIVQPAIGPYKNSNVIKSTSETYQWLIKSTGNYDYAIKYGLELIEEYKKRYNKLHKTEGILLWLKENVPKTIFEGPMTMDVGLAMPEIYKDRDDPVQSYRNYLFHEKSKILKWKYTKMPEWYEKMKNYSNMSEYDLQLYSDTRSRNKIQNLEFAFGQTYI